MPDWLDFSLRALVVVGLAVGGYHAVKRAWADETWSTLALVLGSGLMTVYVCGAVAMVIVYGVLVAWDYFIVFLAIATLYVVGGFYGCFKLIVHMKAMFPPKGSNPASGREVSSN